MKTFRTNYDLFIKYIFSAFSEAFIGPWKRRSLGLISILLGYYFGTNITGYYLERTGQRPLIVLLLVLLIEIIVRFRSIVKTQIWPINWLVIDNIRIGLVYAVVLEAFKLGS